MKKCLALCALLFLASCAASEPLVKNGFLLDTVVTVTLYDRRDPEILDEVFALCARYDGRFSRTDPGSEVYALNHAGGAPVKVSEDMRAVIERAVYYSELTEGKYDITVCPVVDLWDFRPENASPPDPRAVERELARVGYRNVVLEEDGSVRLENGAQIDLGSIAKGYIADRMADYLRGRGVKSALIDLGGNIVAVGGKPSGEPFRIGIQKPFERRSETIGTVEARDLAVVSSGVYERFFRSDGKLYHHILDPATGYPAETGLSAVTVLSGSAVDADALSTCCFLLGPGKGLALAESLEGVEAVLIEEDGAARFTSGFGGTAGFLPQEP